MGVFQNRRFWISALIAGLGMTCMVIALILEIVFGFLHNKSWNKVLDCSAPFPPLEGDTMLSGKKFMCPPTNFIYRKAFRRDSDHDLAFVPLIFVLLIALFLLLPPIFSKKKRRKAVFFEVSFGLLGLTALSSYLMVTFSLSEYQSDLSTVVNDNDQHHPYLDNKQPLPVCQEGDEATQVCLDEGTWQLIVVKCILNGEGVDFSQQVHLKPEIRTRYAAWKTKTWSFDLSKFAYGDVELQTLGFCHYSSHRAASKGLVLCGSICFLCMSLVPCFVKSSDEDEVEEVFVVSTEKSKPRRTSSLQSVISTASTSVFAPSEVISLGVKGRASQQSQWFVPENESSIIVHSSSVEFVRSIKGPSATTEVIKKTPQAQSKRKTKTKVKNMMDSGLSDEFEPEEPDVTSVATFHQSQRASDDGLIQTQTKRKKSQRMKTK